MLSWFAKWINPVKEEREETADERLKRIAALMPDAIGALGEIMETAPAQMVMFPISKLPLPKEDMKIAVKLAWASTQDQKMRAHLAFTYAFLSHFQEDVLTPVEMPSFYADPRFSRGKRSPALTKNLALEERVMEEMKALSAEFAEFELPAERGRSPNSVRPTASTSAARGEILIRPGQRSVVTLKEGADFATLAELMGQDWLERMCRYAHHPDAPQELRNDLADVPHWLGVSSPGDIKVEHRQKFASGLLTYMREGSAPTPELADAFAKSEKSSAENYPTADGPNGALSPEIRGVFDRMFT